MVRMCFYPGRPSIEQARGSRVPKGHNFANLPAFQGSFSFGELGSGRSTLSKACVEQVTTNLWSRELALF